MNEATKSQFAMFRAIIALAWADHSLDEEEQERILVYLNNSKEISAEQRMQLKNELLEPIKMNDVWPDVSDVQDRAHVLNIADTIFWEDGDFSHSEKEIYEKIKSSHMATLDLDHIREDVQNYRKELAKNSEEFKKELHEMRGALRQNDVLPRDNGKSGTLVRH